MTDLTSLTPSARAVLRQIYALFAETDEWPTYERLDFEFDRGGFGDAWAQLCAVPSGLVAGSGFRTLPGDKQSFYLTIAGMGVVGEESSLAAEDLRVFCAAVIVSHRAASETRPPEVPFVRAADIANLVNLPASGRPSLLTRVGEQLRVNAHLWTQFSGAGDSWVMYVNRKGVRGYRDATDRTAFLTAERQRLAGVLEERLAFGRPVTPPAPSSDPELPSPLVSDGRDWIGLLPEDMASGVEARLRSGHPEDALLQSWKVLAASLINLSGLHLDGSALVNQSFKDWDLSTMTATEKSAHQAHVDSIRGLAHMRNVQAHSASAPVTELQAAAFILMAGTCVQWVRGLRS